MIIILIRSLGVWFLILVTAIGNGGLRDLILAPAFGEFPARQMSSVTLSLLILGITLLFVTRLHISRKHQLWYVGGFWLALTLGFEFLFWHYVGGKPWALLLEDYRIWEGRLWALVVLTTAVAPALAGRIRKVEGSAAAGVSGLSS